MGARIQSADATTNTTVVTTTETEAVQLDGITLPSPGRSVTLKGHVELTTGVATTTVTVRVRRGTDTTGTLVDEGNAITIAAAAGSTEPFDVQVVDEPGEVYRQSYVLTVQQAAATGNGTVLYASLTAEIDA